jgi:hypothetical protein
LFFLSKTQCNLFLILSLNLLVSIEIKCYFNFGVVTAPKTEASAPRWKVSALALAPNYKGDKSIMTYKQCLKPWAIARLLPNQKWAIIARYRSRSDADGHLLLLRQRVPNLKFKVVFDLSASKC